MGGWTWRTRRVIGWGLGDKRVSTPKGRKPRSAEPRTTCPASARLRHRQFGGLDRQELQDLLRRVRGLERLIGRGLGGGLDGRGMEG